MSRGGSSAGRLYDEAVCGIEQSASGGVMNSVFRIFLIVTLLGLSACIGARNRDVDRELKEFNLKLDTIRNQQAEHTSELASLNERMRKLSGRLESTQYQSYGLDDPTLPSGHSIPGLPAHVLVEDRQTAERLPAPASAAFQKALQLIPQGRHTEALKNLEEADSYLQGIEGKAEVLFWTGVVFDLQGNSRNALATYNEVISKYPRQRRSATALERLAALFVKLGDRETARLTYEKLVQDFPDSSEAKQAKQALQTLMR